MRISHERNKNERQLQKRKMEKVSDLLPVREDKEKDEECHSAPFEFLGRREKAEKLGLTSQSEENARNFLDPDAKWKHHSKRKGNSNIIAWNSIDEEVEAPVKCDRALLGHGGQRGDLLAEWHKCLHSLKSSAEMECSKVSVQKMVSRSEETFCNGP